MIHAPVPDMIDANGEGLVHLVIKRGHHGRYRFALMTEDGRITGEVAVAVGGDRDLARRRAVAKITILAQTLVETLLKANLGRTCDESSFSCDDDRMKARVAGPIVGGHNGPI